MVSGGLCRRLACQILSVQEKGGVQLDYTRQMLTFDIVIEGLRRIVYPTLSILCHDCIERVDVCFVDYVPEHNQAISMQCSEDFVKISWRVHARLSLLFGGPDGLRGVWCSGHLHAGSKM